MKHKERGIESRVLLVALAPVVATALALTLYFTLLRYDDVEQALRQRGATMARQLAPAAQYSLFSGNLAELDRLIQALAKEPDLSAISVYNQQGIPLATAGVSHAARAPTDLPDGWVGQGANDNILVFHGKVYSSPLSLDDPYVGEVRQPGNLLLGSITIELSRDNLSARKREILLITLGFALFILLAAGLIARRLGRDISEPVLALENAVAKIREGRLATRVQAHPAGTLRMLEEGINTMAAALELAQKRSTEALLSSHTQLRQQSDFADALLTAQSNAGVSLVIIDNNKIVYANQAALDFAGRKREELVHLQPSTVVAPQDRSKLDHLYHRVRQGEAPPSRIEVNVVTPDGIERWSEIAAFGIDRDEGRQVVMLGVDITQRKHDAQQLLKAHATLQAQKEEAERASAAKSRFLAAASHDLRQPLHALILFASQLQELITTKAQFRIAERINAAIGNMSELLESLLDISRLDLSNPRSVAAPIDLAPLLEQIATAHRQAATRKSLRLHVAPTSLWVSSDARYLSRIISNLVSNAVRYTEQGGVVIGARRIGNAVRIEVWDTGIGIEEKHIPFLFQEFYQVANPERDASKGLGLGLAIVYRLANILGHVVGVRSTPGKGTLFTITVPRARPEDKTPAQETGKRILLAIRDEKQRDGLGLMLQDWGYSVKYPHKSEPAPGMEKTANPPDLVICDRSDMEEDDPCLSALADSGIPRICIIDRGEASNPHHGKNACPSLVAPVKPARLRALILHLLAQDEE